ncbi:MAG: hypothetical protein A2825_03555 [Candidatus Taylorbacteria bacterium RIFCSPHIGHO2_01_FULL_43_120]|nr:MAG: hypothetical protein A2825_03555 [Candidatus Taylorbacteria bacterium RIFCSPHIGHO2_01_FULL_43_120]OHA23789.1 MAG: hypothetical protein A3B98_03085 [Candidatus Taylorbacteria bacterium RIFCSPHIGHO2_02_FULL_43_55]OHA30243.1 MAG: hypothetical protein A3E92_01475 [Candidatus Taylorbacteria bacterium RIFCSPHIGHO2_12_FULL_42_34]OHA31993.1 MAG: hypothetical protein A3B09_01240 [Candidatus Taylorbacteria bacterium RIFCSPLOWO2_01_FULL_43_83]OHA38016.1 MAG: hypothetical protein A3H58_01655 [Candi
MNSDNLQNESFQKRLFSMEQELSWLYTEDKIASVLKKLSFFVGNGSCAVALYKKTGGKYVPDNVKGFLENRSRQSIFKYGLKDENCVQLKHIGRSDWYDRLLTKRIISILILCSDSRRAAIILQKGREDMVPVRYMAHLVRLMAAALKRVYAWQEVEEETAKRYTALLEEVSEGVVESDSETRVLYSNKAAAKILGYTKSELLSKRLFDSVHPADRKNVRMYAALLKRKKSMTTVRRLKRKDGSYAVIERHNKLLPDRHQISIWRDITREHEFEKRRDTFVTIAGHELRTPLSLMRLYTEQLELEMKKTRYNGRVQSVLKNMMDQVDRQGKLIDDLLNLTQIRTGKINLNKDWFDMREMVRTAAEHIKDINGKGYTVSVKGNISGYMCGDEGRLYQVVINLLSNAIKYSPRSRNVEVELSESVRQARVDIRDFGIGINKKDHKKIFKRLYRVSEEYSGAGIGLFLSKEIIAKHQGKLYVSSSPGSGSTFSFVLPKSSVSPKKQ